MKNTDNPQETPKKAQFDDVLKRMLSSRPTPKTKLNPAKKKSKKLS